jgi:DNA-binding LacI/PurR family transcriptional regulator
VRTDDPLPGRLSAAGIPCVLAGRPPDGVRVGHVDADNVGGARTAVRHLLARGCRTVATVAGPSDMAPGADRLAGWRAALADADRRADASLVATGDFTRAAGRTAAGALLGRHPEIDGIFAASDLMAVGAIDAARAAGRRIPDDLAVVGFDDGDVAETSDPPLTTIRQPIDEMGRDMARLLVAQLGGAPPGGLTLRTALVVRASV